MPRPQAAPATLSFSDRVQMLNLASDRFRHARDEQSVYRALVRMLPASTALTSASLLLYRREQDALVSVMAHGHGSQLVLRRGNGLAWRVFGSGQTLYLPYVGQDSLPDVLCQGAYLGMPLLGADNDMLGVVVAGSSGERGALTTDDRYLAEVLIQMAAAALDRLATQRRERMAASRYRHMAELSEVLESFQDPLAICREALTALVAQTDFDYGVLYLVKDGCFHPQLMVGDYGFSIAERYFSHRPRLDQGFVGRTMLRGRTEVIYDYHRWDGGLPELQALGLRTVVSAPLRRDGEPYGALVLCSLNQNVEVEEETLRLLAGFARRTERALERARDHMELSRNREDVLRTLGLALEYRDYETKGHTDRVTELAQRLGRAVGLGPADMNALLWGSYLHDAGKIAIPDSILLKPEALDEAEMELVKRHVLIGEEMIRGLRFIPKAVHQIVRHHHENWNGRGYPDGLRGEEIPYLARIFALADVYDALTSQRPYKPVWSHRAAFEEILRQAGKRFDPLLTAAFLDMIQRDAPAASVPSR